MSLVRLAHGPRRAASVQRRRLRRRLRGACQGHARAILKGHLAEEVLKVAAMAGAGEGDKAVVSDCARLPIAQCRRKGYCSSQVSGVSPCGARDAGNARCDARRRVVMRAQLLLQLRGELRSQRLLLLHLQAQGLRRLLCTFQPALVGKGS